MEPKFIAAAAASALLVLGGCVHVKSVETGTILVHDGKKCTETAPSEDVYVEVSYQAGGMPSVENDKCAVKAGRTLTWRGPLDSAVPFNVVFKDTPPRGVERTIPSKGEGFRQRIRLPVPNAGGSYRYSITANGKTLDPVIIIDPN